MIDTSVVLIHQGHPILKITGSELTGDFFYHFDQFRFCGNRQYPVLTRYMFMVIRRRNTGMSGIIIVSKNRLAIFDIVIFVIAPANVSLIDLDKLFEFQARSIQESNPGSNVALFALKNSQTVSWSTTAQYRFRILKTM